MSKYPLEEEFRLEHLYYAAASEMFEKTDWDPKYPGSLFDYYDTESTAEKV